MRKLLCAILGFLFSITLWANQSLSFEHYNVDDGLSQSWVSCIEQDNQGFMWFGTSDGLNRFDGYEFRIFKHSLSDDYSLVNNHIQCIDVDKNGRLWIGTIAGLCYFDQVKNRFFTSQNIPLNSIDALLAIHDILYVCTVNGIQLVNLKNDSLLFNESIYLNKQLGNVRISSIKTDQDGNLWIGTNSGVFFYNITNQSIDKNIINQNIQVTAIDINRENRIWIGTLNNGVFVLSKESNNFHLDAHFEPNNDDSEQISEGRVLDIYQRNSNEIWVGIENGGICIINKFGTKEQSISRHTYNPADRYGLSNNSIYSIFEDRRGDLWIGTYGDGVNFYNNDGGSFRNLHHIHNDKNSLVNNLVNVVAQVNDHLYVGTEGGISKIDMRNNSYQLIEYKKNDKNALQSNAIWALFPDKDNTIWIGTWGGSLNRVKVSDDQEQLSFKNPKNTVGVDMDNIFSIAKQNDDILWLGTMGGGLYVYNIADESYHKFYLKPYEKNVISNEWIRQVLINSQNELWFSTTTTVGYINLNDTTDVHYYHGGIQRGAFNGEGAYVIFEDSEENMWFGSDGGLNYFDRKNEKFASYTIEDGLPNNSIKSVLEDDHGNLWLGTNKGIAQFLDAITKPDIPLFITYDKFDGLQANEFNRRSAFKNKDGLMYFGGIKGLTYFHPDRIKRNAVIPTIVFTDFHIFNQSVEIGEDSPLKNHINFTQSITLSHDQTVFSIDFAALNYVSSPKNQYMYKMEGFDEDWVMANHRRKASYTNLDAGDYTFLVKASNNDGVWNDVPRLLSIKILPPWYKTKLALFLYVFVFLLLLFTFTRISQRRYRSNEHLRLERNQHEHDKELNLQRLQFFTNISHEFRTPLTLIYSPLQDIVQNQKSQLPDDIRKRLQIVFKNAIRLNRLISELMDFRKLQFNKLTLKVGQYDIVDFTKQLIGLFVDEAQQNMVDLKFIKPEQSLLLWFDQRMIEKVIFNLLSNAIKVSPEKSKIVLKIEEGKALPELMSDEYVEEWICISVMDEGPGLEADQIVKIFERFYQLDNVSKTYYSSTGIGLSLAKGLVEKHEGYITVDSEVGQGATFNVWLKKDRKHFDQNDIIAVAKDSISYDLDTEMFEEDEESNDEEESSKLTVLIVEDNHELRKYLITELGQSYKTIEAKNGTIGLDKTLRYMPDIIVSDVLMPEINGYELCKAIKGNDKISHIPIILLTARAAIEDQIEGAESGADGYLTKPFNPRLLKSKINQLIKSRQQLFVKYSAELNLISQNENFTTFDRDFLTQVSEYIVENIGNTELSVEEVGEKMALSRSQLYRKIKSLSGFSANEFIRRIRLEQAKKMIETKKLPIGEVGFSVGFSSPSYFSKCYKEHFGKLPSEE